jgi:hypothetical protein
LKYFFIIFSLLLCLCCSAQPLVSNRGKIESAEKELETTIMGFSTCAVSSDLDLCLTDVVKKEDNEYKKYLIGGMLYAIDTARSFQLHREAYLANPNELNFNLEYAIELHRKGKFEEAARIYERYGKERPDDFRVNVWLADCYMNLGDIDKAIENWGLARHPQNHTGIDMAICSVYGKADQFRIRNNYRKEIIRGNYKDFCSLIFLDMNWKTDWWNTHVQEFFLDEDIRLLESKSGKNDVDVNSIKAYIKIKKLSSTENPDDSIKFVLTSSKLILGSNPLPANGLIASDLLRICFMNHLLSEQEFYTARGDDVLKLARSTKDKELLNIYAYLQARVKGKVDPSVDKLGWTEFKDERFAISYFIGKGDKNKSDDKELAQALVDFPNSSKLYWIKVNCAKIENIPLRPYLIELIKKEFRTLGSDPDHYSYPLKSFFGYLQSEK